MSILVILKSLKNNYQAKKSLLIGKKISNNSIKNYGLCPGAPSLSWDAMLNMTKARKLVAKLAISI